MESISACALHSGPVVATVWEGKGVVVTGRKLVGATNPLASGALSAPASLLQADRDDPLPCAAKEPQGKQ